MPSIKVNGTELHVQYLGEQNKQGPASAVVMMHGLLTGNMTSWYFGAGGRLAQNFPVTLYDLRGHGLSAAAKSGYDIATMVCDLEALILQQNLQSVTLVGHSYGALIALYYAIKNPSKVNKLVLVEAPLPPSRAAEMEQFLQRSPEQMVEALPPHIRQAIANQKRQATKLLAQITFLLTATDLIPNLKNEQDVTNAALHTLTMPTLLVYGRYGYLHETAERLLRYLPRARLEYLEGGHHLPSEKSVELSNVIETFMKQEI